MQDIKSQRSSVTYVMTSEEKEAYHRKLAREKEQESLRRKRLQERDYHIQQTHESMNRLLLQ